MRERKKERQDRAGWLLVGLQRGKMCVCVRERMSARARERDVYCVCTIVVEPTLLIGTREIAIYGTGDQ